MQDRFTGVMTPLLTPYNDDFSIAEDLYLDHASACLAGGAHYLSPFGTTSEATSHSVAERMRMAELLISTGTARPDQLMPGTGLCNLSETVQLSRHAVELGCAAVMTLPPFFFVAAPDEGMYRYFSTLIERVGSDTLKICLYNIPQNTGIGISPALAARLNEAFPEVVAAYKDSSGDWDNTEAVIRAAPGISVFPGSESMMLRAMALGGGGCISASCNSNVMGIRAMYDLARAGDIAGAEALLPQIDAHRAAVQGGGLIPGLKALKAHQTGDARWLNLRPPLLPATLDMAGPLAETILEA
ncbi:dihydrodipicolinate synthase family protein [Roseovarius sp. LXJ103]|uniref:dihydrodipicolinate synthase family protein n=1 Tax=Roseovarius carneus TaxID=2853164 RepID=UPI000D61A429|nr:dihydrodipicolinate synthase family protein [Roseovarius carneus]MBZ8117950.1 dihydrodipicolinate synthase family protein [Roseovarius carneus]PWE36296.1 dihydrodipicolinate synthase family protein [Pelagicola sp. LXJ1103]